MRCCGCNKDVFWLDLNPVPIRDSKGEVIQPRKTNLFCNTCIGIKTPKVNHKSTSPKYGNIDN